MKILRSLKWHLILNMIHNLHKFYRYKDQYDTCTEHRIGKKSTESAPWNDNA